MKRLFTLFLACFLMVLGPLTVSATERSNTVTSWPKGPSVYSESAILMEASTGLILYEKNINEKHYPASITKIMTTLLALENSCLNEIVTFSKNAVFGIERNSSHIGIDVGEELTMEQSLYGIMLESANEVSYAVAEHVSGDMTSFASLMNEKAKELGCTNTNFVNSHGLHDDNHYTTAHDMALIARDAINNSTFRKITSTISYIIPPTNIQEDTRYLNNHHKMLKPGNNHYSDCIGGKTGYTTKSKNTLVTFAKRGDLELISVVMRSDSANQYTDTKLLLDFGFDNFTAYDINKTEGSYIIETSPFFTIYNNLFSDLNAPIKTCSSSFIVLPNSAKLNDVDQNIEYLKHETNTDDLSIIGSINYSYGTKQVGFTKIRYNHLTTPKLMTTINPIKMDKGLLFTPQILEYNRHSSKLKLFIFFLLILLVGILVYSLIIKKSIYRQKRITCRKRKTRKSFLDNKFKD